MKRRSIDRAGRLYTRFMDLPPESVERIHAPDSYAIVGRVHALRYETVEDGETVYYEHEFRGRQKPVLMIGEDGKHALLFGGFTFGERGFVDHRHSKR
jgi:hypothetical protein